MIGVHPGPVGFLMNQWQIVISFCLNHKDDRGKPDPLPVIPTDGEPWLSYRAVAVMTEKSPEYISNVVSKHKLKKHPIFAGFVKMSSFEKIKAVS